MGAAVLVLAVVASGLAGAAAERMLVARENASSNAATQEKQPCRRRESPEERRLRSWRDLGLSEEQKSSILAVLDRRSAQAAAFWEQHRPQWDSTVDKTRAEIRAILTAEQAAEFDRQRSERRKRDSLQREEYRRRCGETARANGSRDGRGTS
jgi:Spy/CpxP family protein refolding chaperone